MKYDWSKEVYNTLFIFENQLVIQVRPIVDDVVEQELYKDKKISLNSYWNKSGKLIGYIVEHSGKPVVSSNVCKSVINSFLVLYTKKVPEKTKLNILFDDQNIRLLAHESKRTSDYLLVSKWRVK